MRGRFPYRVRAARDRSRPTVTLHSAETGGEGRTDGRRRDGGGSARCRCRCRRAPVPPARPARALPVPPPGRAGAGRQLRGDGATSGPSSPFASVNRGPQPAYSSHPPRPPAPAAFTETPSSFWKRDFYGGRGGHSKHALEPAAVQTLARQRSPAAWSPLHAITPTAAVREEHVRVPSHGAWSRFCKETPDFSPFGFIEG